MNWKGLLRSRWVTLPAKLGVTAATLWLLSRRIQFHDIAHNLARTDVRYFLGGLAFTMVGVVLQAVRWKVVMNVGGIPLRKFLYFVLIGYFFNLFLPTSLGGEALKILYFGRKHGYTQESFGANLFVKIAGMLMMYATAAVGMGFYWSDLERVGFLSRLTLNGPKLLALGAGLIAIAVAAMVLWKRIRSQKWLATMAQVIRDPVLLAKALGLTLLLQIAMILSVYLLFLSIYPPTSVWAIAAFMPIIFTVLALPISFGGVGVREYVNTVLFSDLGGIPAEAVLSVTVLGYAFAVVPALLGGAWFLFRKRQEEAESPSPAA